MDATHAQGRSDTRQHDKVGLSAPPRTRRQPHTFFRASHKLCTDDCSPQNSIQCSHSPGCKVSLWLFAVVAWWTSIFGFEHPDVLGVALSKPAATDLHMAAEIEFDVLSCYSVAMDWP